MEDFDKVQVIRNLEPPTNLSKIKSFLGHTRYYRKSGKIISR
jgi:hypothetical protein